MEHLWKALCECLADELERQHTVMAVCCAQREAALSRDVEHLRAKTEALELLIHEASVAEKSRLRTITTLVTVLELPRDRQTLTELIGLAPEPWSRRLSELQTELQSLLKDVRVVVADTQHVLRHGQAIVERTIRILIPENEIRNQLYGSKPAREARPALEPVLIDSRG